MSGSQIPEKSGLPSGVRGVTARRFGEPSGNLGTPAVGYVNHCAATDGPLTTAITTVIQTNRATVLIVKRLAGAILQQPRIERQRQEILELVSTSFAAEVGTIRTN
jgi:hypothetical protein